MIQRVLKRNPNLNSAESSLLTFFQESLKKIEEKGQVDYNSLNDYLQTHLIDVSAARSNDFEKHIVLRAKLLLDAIEKATGKIISGKDSDEVISKFGERLIF